MPFERIVVGTDGSDSAARAVGQAARLAETVGAELIVSHAYRKDVAEAGSLRELGASLLRDACAPLGPDLAVRSVLREGDAADVLLRIAREVDAGLIVVGDRGMGRRQVLIGSVPSRVAHRAPCDILIAHTSGDPRTGFHRMLVATDHSPTAARAEATGKRLAEALGAETDTLHVTEGDPAKVIVETAARQGVDLVVVGNKGMTGARRFLSSVPSRVARDASCHVLLVKTT